MDDSGQPQILKKLVHNISIVITLIIIIIIVVVSRPLFFQAESAKSRDEVSNHSQWNSS